MRVLVLYDSFFGNTEKVAQVIAANAGSGAQVTSVKVADAKVGQLKEADLLFVGSPTRGFNASEGMVAFLKSIPAGSLNGIKAAVFDTRIALEDMKPAFLRFMQKRAGYADVKMVKLLKAAGADVLLPTMGFNVAKSEGPLKEGEVDQAAAWAKQILEGNAK